MDLLRAMRTFVRVVDEGSFAGAARALDQAPAVITRLVAELEEHLGARLIHRTTRRMALTEVGETYLERVRQILLDVDEAEAATSAAMQEVRGHLRVLCPPAFAVHQLAKVMPEFHARYPRVTVELTVPGPVETVDESHDITIITGRQPLEGSFVARRLACSEVILCASPEYLERRGRPSHPNDLLEQHDALVPALSDIQSGLTFWRGTPGTPGAESVTIAPGRGALSTVHTDTMYAAALAGMGIAGLPSFVIEDALMEHALERVLPHWRVISISIWAAIPTRKHLPARTRAMLDFLVETFGGAAEDRWLTAAGCATRGGPDAGDPGCPLAGAAAG
jgi:DNA-binding transcriptional LysR family regulator